MPPSAIAILQLSVTVFFAILFLQSGLDKVFDWQGNLQFHTEHFAKSPLNRFSKQMLLTMTVLEVTCGLLSLIGAVQLLFGDSRRFALYAGSLASFIFLCLFFGQRISKDYKGAATIVTYFIVALIGLIFLS